MDGVAPLSLLIDVVLDVVSEMDGVVDAVAVLRRVETRATLGRSSGQLRATASTPLPTAVGQFSWAMTEALRRRRRAMLRVFCSRVSFTR